jgi:predicted TIM-barrel fold metal-dependent hydrolase
VRTDDLVLISVDDHIAEPADMFVRHVPDRWKDLSPRVVEDDEGVQQWWYGDIAGRNLGLNAVAGKPPEYYNVDATRYDEMRPGCYDVHERVRDMSAGGYLAGLNFPNWPGFSGQVLNQGPDRTANLVMIQAYNDWHVDEWCGAYPGRFIPSGVLPMFDAGLAAKEVHRLAAKGCHAINFSENPAALKMPSIHSGYWDPLFAACSDTGTIVCMHLGSSSRPLDMSPDAPPLVALSLSPVRTVNTLLEFLLSDIWLRFPDLTVSLTEGEIGWIPFFLERAEQSLVKHGAWTQHQLPPGMTIRDIFRKNFLTCLLADPVGIRLIEDFNVDNLCWESDYPHSDSAWPRGPEVAMEMLGGLDDATINKITHENASRHYQFDPFAVRPKEHCTVAALRAQASDVDTATTVGRRGDAERNRALFAARWESQRAEAGARLAGADGQRH